MQCKARHCTALLCTALHCTALHCTLNYTAHCNVQYIALHCTLNCTIQYASLDCKLYCTVHCPSHQSALHRPKLDTALGTRHCIEQSTFLCVLTLHSTRLGSLGLVVGVCKCWSVLVLVCAGLGVCKCLSVLVLDRRVCNCWSVECENVGVCKFVVWSMKMFECANVGVFER